MSYVHFSKNNLDSLGKYFYRALSILHGVERQLAKNTELPKNYKEFLDKYESLLHMRRLSNDC